MTDQWLPPDDRSPPAPPAWEQPPPPPIGTPPVAPAYPGTRPPWAEEIKPGVVALRPLTLAEILDGALRVIRRQPRLTLGIAALVACVQRSFAILFEWAIGALPGTGSSDQPLSATTAATADALALVLVVDAVLGLVLTGLLAPVIAEAVLGRTLEARALSERLKPLAVRLTLAALLVGVLPFIGLLLVIPGVFLWGAFALAVPALVLERTTVRGAIRRSWQLSVPDWWRVTGIRALAVLIAAVVSFVISVPFALGADATRVGNQTFGIWGLIVLAVGGVIATAVTTPFVAAVLGLLYIDRRMRAEALDITLSSAVRSAPSS
jgi:hypothetical protein